MTMMAQLSPEIQASAAFQVLRPSTRQAMRLILHEIDKHGGTAQISHDVFEANGVGRTPPARVLYNHWMVTRAPRSLASPAAVAFKQGG